MMAEGDYDPNADLFNQPGVTGSHRVAEQPPQTDLFEQKGPIAATAPLTTKTLTASGPNAEGKPQTWAEAVAGSAVAPDITQAVKTAGDIVSGNNPALGGVKHPEIGGLRTENLNVSHPGALAINAQAMVSRDPDEMRRVILQHQPNATFRYDDTGADGKPTPGANLMVQVPGQPEMYVMRPGATWDKYAYYGAQAVPALLTRGRTLLSAGGLGAGQETVSGAVSHALGGQESWFDPTRVATAGLLPIGLGLGFRGVLSGIDRLLTVPRPGAAADIRLRVGNADEHGYSLTEGQATNSPTQLAHEDAAVNNPTGAGSRIRQLHDANYDQTQINKQQIVAENSGVVPPRQPGQPAPPLPPGYQPSESQFGDTLAENIRTHFRSLENDERTAWGRLGDVSPNTQSGRSVSFTPDVSTDILARSGDIMRRAFGSPAGPNGTYLDSQLEGAGAAAVGQLGQLRARLMPSATGPGGTGPVPTEFNLGDLQDLRQSLRNAAEANRGTPGGRAIGQMRSAVDAAIAAAETTPGRLNGNVQALADFRTANAATRAKYQFTEGNNPATENYIDRVLHEPGFGGQQATNGVLGSGTVVTPSGGTTPIVMHLGQHLGDQSDGMNALRGAFTQRTLYGASSPEMEATKADAGVRQPLYGTTANRIDNQVSGQGRDATTLLLPPEAHGRLSDLSQALRTLNASYAGQGPALNTSRTGYTIPALKQITTGLPLGLGRSVDAAMARSAAERSVDRGIDLTNRVRRGQDLGISLPREVMPGAGDPTRPWLSPTWAAQRQVPPVARAGGLLFSQPVRDLALSLAGGGR